MHSNSSGCPKICPPPVSVLYWLSHLTSISSLKAKNGRKTLIFTQLKISNTSNIFSLHLTNSCKVTSDLFTVVWPLRFTFQVYSGLCDDLLKKEQRVYPEAGGRHNPATGRPISVAPKEKNKTTSTQSEYVTFTQNSNQSRTIQKSPSSIGYLPVVRLQHYPVGAGFI